MQTTATHAPQSGSKHHRRSWSWDTRPGRPHSHPLNYIHHRVFLEARLPPRERIEAAYEAAYPVMALVAFTDVSASCEVRLGLVCFSSKSALPMPDAPQSCSSRRCCAAFSSAAVSSGSLAAGASTYGVSAAKLDEEMALAPANLSRARDA